MIFNNPHYFLRINSYKWNYWPQSIHISESYDLYIQLPSRKYVAKYTFTICTWDYQFLKVLTSMGQPFKKISDNSIGGKNGMSFVFWFVFHWLVERVNVRPVPLHIFISHLFFRIPLELEAATKFIGRGWTWNGQNKLFPLLCDWVVGERSHWLTSVERPVFKISMLREVFLKLLSFLYHWNIFCSIQDTVLLFI